MIERIQNLSNYTNRIDKPEFNRNSEKINSTTKKDRFEFSGSNKLFEKVDNILNLGERKKIDVSDLSPEEREKFYQILGKLFQSGIIGYEVLEINGRPEKHFIENQIGNTRTYGKKLYKKPY